MVRYICFITLFVSTVSCVESDIEFKENHYLQCVNSGKPIFTEKICRCMADEGYSKLTPEQVMEVAEYRAKGLDEKQLPQFKMMVDTLKECVKNS